MTTSSPNHMPRPGLLLFALFFSVLPATAQATQVPDVDRAVVPVVYPLERAGWTASGCERVRYTFYGNAFFLGCDGLLLTAAHVLEPFPAADEITLLVPDETHAVAGGDCRRIVSARVVARDPDTDLALLRLEPGKLDPRAIDRFTLAERAPAMGSAVEMAVFKPARAASWTDGAARVETRQGVLAQVDRKRMRAAAEPVDVYLITTEVVEGESGAPLYDPATEQVVGVVSGISLSGGRRASPGGQKPRGAVVSLAYIRSLLLEAGCAADKPQGLKP